MLSDGIYEYEEGLLLLVEPNWAELKDVIPNQKNFSVRNNPRPNLTHASVKDRHHLPTYDRPSAEVSSATLLRARSFRWSCVNAAAVMDDFAYLMSKWMQHLEVNVSFCSKEIRHESHWGHIHHRHNNPKRQNLKGIQKQLTKGKFAHTSQRWNERKSNQRK